MSQLKLLQDIEANLVAADDQAPLPDVRRRISKLQAALALLEERGPSFARRAEAVQVAERARLEARHALQHPTTDDAKALLKLHEASVIAEGRWRFAVQQLESYEPEIRTAHGIVGESALPKDLREARRATESLQNSLLLWTMPDGRPERSYNTGGRRDAERAFEQAEILSPAVVSWLPYAERQQLRNLRTWNKTNPRSQVSAVELEVLFSARRNAIEQRRRRLANSAANAAVEAAALAGAEAP